MNKESTTMTITDITVADVNSAPKGVRVATVATSLSSNSVSTAGLALVEAEVTRQGGVIDSLILKNMPRVVVGDEVPAAWAEAIATVAAADAVVLGVGIHGWAPSGISKIAVELLGDSLNHKPVAFVVGMGSTRSHLAHVNLAVSLVLERDVIWVPSSLQLTEDTVNDPGSLERAAAVASALLTLTRRLVTT